MPAPTARPGTPKGCAFGLPRPLITFQRRMARDLQSRFERAGRAWPISGRRRPRRPRPFRTLGRSAPSDEGKIPQPRASDEGAAPSSRGRRGRRGRHRPPSSWICGRAARVLLQQPFNHPSDPEFNTSRGPSKAPGGEHSTISPAAGRRRGRTSSRRRGGSPPATRRSGTGAGPRPRRRPSPRARGLGRGPRRGRRAPRPAARAPRRARERPWARRRGRWARA